MAAATLALVIVVLLVMIGKKMNPAVALLLSSVLLIMLNEHGPATFFAAIKKTVSDPVTYTMTLTILLISVLGRIMERYQMLERMVFHLERVLRSAKLTIMLAPTMIGLLLVTGGALMSCPIVDALGERLKMSKSKRAAVNMVFRHGLYFVYPLSSTMILASQLGEFQMIELIRLQFPVTLFIFSAGYFVFLRGVEDCKPESITRKELFGHLLRFLLYSLPITLSIVVTAVFQLPFHFSLPFGIGVAFVIHGFDVKADRRLQIAESPLTLIIKGVNMKILYVIWAILLFKWSIDSLPEIGRSISDFVHAGIPMEFVIVLICILISFPTGNFQPSLAVVYPLILPVVQSQHQLLLYSYLIYAIGFTAYFTSPLHMCQVLTIEHFNITIPELYKDYRPFLLVLGLFLIGWYFVLRLILIS